MTLSSVWPIRVMLRRVKAPLPESQFEAECCARLTRQRTGAVRAWTGYGVLPEGSIEAHASQRPCAATDAWGYRAKRGPQRLATWPR